MSSLGDLPKRIRDVSRAGAGDRAVQPGDGGVESLPELRGTSSAGTRAKLIWRFRILGARDRAPEQASGVSVLPGHLLALGRRRQIAQPAREAGARRRELVGAHGIRPAVTRVPNGSHDVGALAIEFVVYGHGGWLFVLRATACLSPILVRTRLGAPDWFPTPKVLRAGTRLALGVPATGAVALLHEPLEIRPQNPHTATDPHSRQRALVNPVAHGLLIQLEHLGDLCNREKGILRSDAIQGNLL
jgi:hypothetical protein